MKWNIFLLIVSLFMLAQEVVFKDYGYLAHAETIAEELATKVAVDKCVLLDNLEDIFESYKPQYVAFNWILWAVFSFIVTIKLVFDFEKQRKKELE